MLFLECIKAFRVRYENMYVMNPNGEILVATRRRPEHWCVRKSKCCADRVAKLEIFQKVKSSSSSSSHHHDSLRALDHILYLAVWFALISFVLGMLACVCVYQLQKKTSIIIM